MNKDGASMPLGIDPCVIVGRVASLLVQGSGLPEALAALVAGLGLRTAVVRTSAGTLLGVGGEVLHAVPQMRALPHADSSIELPVLGPVDERIATLTIVGARPSQLPALRAVAAVLGLSLATPPVRSGEALMQAAEDDRDDLADALHDGPVQSLVVARYAADAAVRGGNASVARDAVQQALIEVRRVLWNLRPRGAGGLDDALAKLSLQLVEAGGKALAVRGSVEAVGPSAGLTFRLVQAVALPSAGPVRLALARDGSQLIVDIIGGAPLASPERWAMRASTLGGDLSCSAGRLRLALPLTNDALSADARTTT